MSNNTKKKEPTFEEKVNKFAKNFWSAFLFTKDGKAKSGYGVYTFFVSLALIFIYGGVIVTLISILNDPLSSLSPFLQNLIESLLTAFVVGLIVMMFHYIIKDKRMMFGSHLWLILYIVASVITMYVFLRGTGAFLLFMSFLAWFVLIPVGLVSILSFYLFRRDYKPNQKELMPEPEYMKYIRRR